MLLYHFISHRMYNSPIEAELNALNKCGALLSELDATAKIRVLKYLVEMFDLAKLLQPVDGGDESFKNQQSNGASNASSPKLIKSQEQNQSSSKKPIGDEVEVEEANTDFPTMKDVVMRDFPKVEPEWVLIYAFYASDFSKETFTRDDILKGYTESNRYDAQRIKNLSGNFKACVLKEWIKGVNSTTYRVTAKGKEYAELVLAGKSEGKPKAPSQAKKKAPKENK